jgi:hypothetical protein
VLSSSPIFPCFLPFPSLAIAFDEAFIMLELALDLSTSSEVSFLLSSNATQLLPIPAIFLHRVYYNLWFGCWVKIFGSRSMFFHQILYDTHLSSGFTGVFCFLQWRRAPFLCPRTSSWHARAREYVSLSGAWWPCILHVRSLAPIFSGSRHCLMNPAGERSSSGGAWSSRAAISSF